MKTPTTRSRALSGNTAEDICCFQEKPVFSFPLDMAKRLGLWERCAVSRGRTHGHRLPNSAKAGARRRCRLGTKDGRQLLSTFPWRRRNSGSSTPHAPRCLQARCLHSHTERMPTLENSERYGVDNLSANAGDRRRNSKDGRMDKCRRPPNPFAARRRKPAHPRNPKP